MSVVRNFPRQSGIDLDELAVTSYSLLLQKFFFALATGLQLPVNAPVVNDCCYLSLLY